MAVQVAGNLLEQSKAAKALNGHLLPKRDASKELAFVQLKDIYSALILDKNEKEVVALSAVLRYSPKEAYCCFSEINPTLREKALRIEPASTVGPFSDQRHTTFKVVEVGEPWTNQGPELKSMFSTHTPAAFRSGLEQAFEAATQKALGVLSLECTKNVTMDISCEGEDLSVWRDQIGFVVVDRREFVEVGIRAEALAEVLEHGFEAKVTLERSSAAKVLEYDSAVLPKVDRSEYLSFLCHLDGSHIYAAMEGGQCCGVSVVFESTILFLYADSMSIARSLLKFLATQRPKQSLSLTVVRDDWLDTLLCDTNVIHTRKPIRRLHTTYVPSNVDWNKVHIVNCGMHLV